MGNATEQVERHTLTPELIDFIDQWRDRPGNLIMVLHKVQETFGYVPREMAFAVAERLDVPLAKIYGVLTFYHFFKLQKPGRHQIAVCMGTACYLKGGEDLIHEIESLLDVGLNCTSEDGDFSLQAVRCIGCCGLAPVMTIDGEVYGRLTKEQIPEILAKYKGQ